MGEFFDATELDIIRHGDMLGSKLGQRVYDALTATKPAEGWRPIETAPKDGTFVLLHCPNGQLESGEVTVGGYYRWEDRAENGRFRKGQWDGWLGMDADIASSWCEPTHWHPLPASPSEEPSP